MTDERLKKMFGNIPTGKYKQLEKNLIMGELVIPALARINPINTIDLTLIAIWIINYISYVSMRHYHVVDFTKDYNELEAEYNAYLSNYRALMDTLDIDSYASLCASFYYLYRNGYLSISGVHDKSCKNFFEGRRFQLVNLFNGCGVCRHLATSLKDILNFCGYPSSATIVYTRKYEDFTQEEIESMKSYFQKLVSEEIDERLKEIIVDSFINMQIASRNFNALNESDKQESIKKIQKEKGDHVIATTNVGGKNVAYDPTTNVFYQYKDKKTYNLVDEMGKIIEFRTQNIDILNTPSEKKILLNNLKLESINLEGLCEETEETGKKMNENTDILQSFRSDNLDLMKSLKDKSYRLIQG